MTARFQLSLTGSFALLDPDGVRINLGGTRMRQLVAYLALREHMLADRMQLSTLFWPHAGAEIARNNLRQTLFRLRKVLANRLLVITAQDIGFDPDALRVDLGSSVEAAQCEAILPGLDGGSAAYQAWLDATRAKLAGTKPSLSSPPNARQVPIADSAHAEPVGAAMVDVRRRRAWLILVQAHPVLDGEGQQDERQGQLEAWRELALIEAGKVSAGLATRLFDGQVFWLGAERSHGDDAERAVRLALALRRASRMRCHSGLWVRIAVLQSDVIRSDEAGRASPSNSALARGGILLTQLEPGAIALDTAVQATLAERLNVRALVKTPGGAAGWLCLGLHEPDEVSPLVGRRQEYAFFQSLFAEAAPRGLRLVQVRAPAGLGKSRLLRAAADLAHEHELHTVRVDIAAGHGLDLFAACLQALRAIALAQAVNDIDSLWLRDLLGERLSPSEFQRLAALDAVSRRDRACDLLVATLNAAGRTVLLFDDAHAISPEQAEALRALMLRSQRVPVTIVLACRPEGAALPRVLAHRPTSLAMTTFDLAGLSEDDAAELAAHHGVAPETRRACIRKAEGHPLFLEHLLRHARNGGDSALPESIASLVQARLDSLPAPARIALGVAAVLDHTFTEGDLMALGVADAGIVEILRQQHLLEAAQNRWTVSHSLIRDAVREAIPLTNREAIHRRAAAHFSAFDIERAAGHWAAAGAAQAAEAYAAAAHAALARHDNSRAVHCASCGLEQRPKPALRFQLLMLKAEALREQGETGPAFDAYSEALASTRSVVERAQALVGLASIKRLQDELEAGLADLDEAERLLADADAPQLRARLALLRGLLCFPLGDAPRCRAAHAEAVALAELASDADVAAAALGGLADADYAVGRLASAEQQLSASLERAAAHGFERTRVGGLSLLTTLKSYRHGQAAGAASARDAITSARAIGHWRAEINGQLGLVVASFGMRDVRTCIGALDEVRRLVARAGAWRFEAIALLYLARLALLDDELGVAVSRLDEALAISEATGPKVYGPQVRGLQALSVPVADTRIVRLREAERLLASGCLAHNHLRFYLNGALALLEIGEDAQAAAYLDTLTRFVGDEPLPWVDLHVRAMRGLLPGAAPMDWSALATDAHEFQLHGLAELAINLANGIAVNALARRRGLLT